MGKSFCFFFQKEALPCLKYSASTKCSNDRTNAIGYFAILNRFQTPARAGLMKCMAPRASVVVRFGIVPANTRKQLNDLFYRFVIASRADAWLG